MEWNRTTYAVVAIVVALGGVVTVIVTVDTHARAYDLPNTLDVLSLSLSFSVCVFYTHFFENMTV